jgi:hypothetical protein
MRTAAVIVGTVLLMIASGAAAAFGTARLLMMLGLKYHNNYEYYGLTGAGYLVPILGLACFLLPGIIVWKSHDKHWRISLGTLLGVITLVALLFGVIALLIRSDLI